MKSPLLSILLTLSLLISTMINTPIPVSGAVNQSELSNIEQGCYASVEELTGTDLTEADSYENESAFLSDTSSVDLPGIHVDPAAFCDESNSCQDVLSNDTSAPEEAAPSDEASDLSEASASNDASYSTEIEAADDTSYSTETEAANDTSCSTETEAANDISYSSDAAVSNDTSDSPESTSATEVSLPENTEVPNETSVPDSTDVLSDISVPDEETVGATVYTYINVTWSEFGANGGDGADDTTAINNALYAAHLSSQQNGKTIEVYLPAGTYYINNVLLIYSNTWLHLDSKATITRTNQAKEMLSGVHRDKNNKICYQGCTHTGYTQVVNTKVSGGRWNGGISSNNCGGSIYSRDILTFRHCSNITIADTVIGDDCSIHSVNIDGVKNLTVSGVTFQNHYRYTGTEAQYYGGKYVSPSSYEGYWTREALHIDEINYDNYSTAYPLEVLPCQNISVTGCTFRNVVSGLGTHNYNKDNPTVNVTIRDNLFHTVCYNCIDATNFKDMTVIYNKAYNVTGFLYGKDCGVKYKPYSYIQHNTVECGKINNIPARDTIYCIGASKVFIENNTFRNIQTGCINIDAGTSYKTDTAVSEAVINLNLFENATGFAGESKDSAAVKVGKGCKIDMWKNTLYLQEHKNSSYKTYGVLFHYAASGSILSKNIIRGGNYAVCVNGTNGLNLYSNELSWTKNYGVYQGYCSNLEITGNIINNNTGYGIRLDGCSNIKSWRNVVLLSGTKDLWIERCSSFEGLGSFSVQTFYSTDSSHTWRKYIQGDMNFDGALTVHDLQILSKYVSNPDNATKAESYMGDVSWDQKLTQKDIDILSTRIVK